MTTLEFQFQIVYFFSRKIKGKIKSIVFWTHCFKVIKYINKTLFLIKQKLRNGKKKLKLLALVSLNVIYYLARMKIEWTFFAIVNAFLNELHYFSQNEKKM